MDTINSLKDLIIKNVVFYKPIMLAGIISGGVYLNSFLSEYGVPFPLEIGVLTSTLLVVGILSIILVSITACYLLLIYLVSLDPFKTNYHLVINTSKLGVYSSKKRNYLKLYFFTYLLPMSFLIEELYAYDNTKSNTHILYILVGTCILIPFSYSYYISKGSYKIGIERIKFSCKMTVHVLVSQFASFMSLFFFIAILVPRVGSLSNWESIVIITFYLLTNLLCLIPIFSRKKSEKILTCIDKKITPDSLIKETQGTIVWFIFATLLLTSYLPPFSPYVGELPLRILNIGGGVDFVAVDEKKQCDSWPEFIIFEKTPNSCTTYKGKLIVQLGDRGFILFHDGETEKVVSLNLSKSSMISEIPKDSKHSQKYSPAEAETANSNLELP